MLILISNRAYREQYGQVNDLLICTCLWLWNCDLFFYSKQLFELLDYMTVKLILASLQSFPWLIDTQTLLIFLLIILPSSRSNFEVYSPFLSFQIIIRRLFKNLSQHNITQVSYDHENASYQAARRFGLSSCHQSKLTNHEQVERVLPPRLEGSAIQYVA